MKITILNGNPEAGDQEFEGYLSRLERALEQKGQQVEALTLREMDVRSCTGCFDCWVKTPGECITADDGPKIRQAVMGSDFTLWAAPLKMGYPSGLLKRTMDKFLPLIHPYFDVVNAEAHHRGRYRRYPLLGLLVKAEADTDSADMKIITDMFRRTALNFKSKLAFAMRTDQPCEEVAQAIASRQREWRGLPELPRATRGICVTPPTRLTVFNGSPRGQKGNTPLLWRQFLDGFCASGAGRSFEMLDLNRPKEAGRCVEVFGEAECVLLGFPLYTDAMPGIVKEFIDRLEPFRGRNGNPPLGFLVQSGFPESAHSRYVEQYLQKLAARLGSPYLGTIVKGGAEGTRVMPETMTHSLFESLRSLGRGFGETGGFDPLLLKEISGLERYPAYLAPLFWVLSKTSMLNSYWDSQLKENGAYERRFARPYKQV